MLNSKSTSRQRKSADPVLVEPQYDLARMKQELKPFGPLDLVRLVEIAKASRTLTPELILETYAALQIREVLRLLGFPQDNPNLAAAFYRLAEVLLGVGNVTYKPRRQESAEKWEQAGPRLVEAVAKLMRAGKSRRKACAEIASDPEKWGVKVYQQRARPLGSGAKERFRRAAAFLRHLDRMRHQKLTIPFDRFLGLEFVGSPLASKLRRLAVDTD